MKPKIEQSFWRDKQFEEAAPEIRLTVLWLITNPSVSMLGLQEYSERRFAFETGLDRSWLRKTLEFAPTLCVVEGDWLFIRNFIRRQFQDGAELVRNQIAQALLRACLALDEPLRRVVLKEYPVLADALNKGLAGPYEALRKLYGLPVFEEALAKALPRGSGVDNTGDRKSQPDSEGGECAKPLASPTEGLAKGKGIGTGIGTGTGTGIGIGTDGAPSGSGDADLAHKPSVEEVVEHCRGVAGIDPDYGRRFWEGMTNTHGWIKNRRLVLWKSILAGRWGEDRTRWMDGTAIGSPYKKTAANGSGQADARWKQVKDLEAAIAGHVANRQSDNFRPGHSEGEAEELRRLRERLAELKKGGGSST